MLLATASRADYGRGRGGVKGLSGRRFLLVHAGTDQPRQSLLETEQLRSGFALSSGAEFFTRYGVTSIVGDRYAPGFVIEGFAEHDVAPAAIESAIQAPRSAPNRSWIWRHTGDGGGGMKKPL